MACAGMVFVMAVIGAITRLTESGLSMVEWRPFIGMLPPHGDAEWQRVFELYQQTPEYMHKNGWMEIEDFKRIFFWEWLHRLWGRMIGVVYGLPFFLFLLRGSLPRKYLPHFFGLLLLGGSQGLIGWWMVKSGLIDRPDVSHFRLATHLGMAFLIYACIVGLLLSVKKSGSAVMDEQGVRLPLCIVKPFGLVALLMFSITMVWGAFVAGLDAGMIYNHFPQMARGSIFPEEPYFQSAILHDHAWVQFTHRALAVTTGVVIFLYGWVMKSYLIQLVVVFQVMLGITALVTQLWIPVAAMHQAGAFILLTVLIIQIHRSFYSPCKAAKQSEGKTLSAKASTKEVDAL